MSVRTATTPYVPTSVGALGIFSKSSIVPATAPPE